MQTINLLPFTDHGLQKCPPFTITLSLYKFFASLFLEAHISYECPPLLLDIKRYNGTIEIK